VFAERAFLRKLEGGCQVPVAAFAELDGDGMEVARAVDENGAEAIGLALAERLLDQGAAEILASVRAAAAPAVSEP
jgi:hydroxymethylbilane synthase